MSIVTSNRVALLKPSATLAVAARAEALIAEGKDIINLSLGEPDFDTPSVVCDAAIAAIHAGQTRYTAVDGTPELKQAIISKLKRDNQLEYQPNQVLASSGAKHSLFNLFLALLNPGDEVIIPAPFWVSYPDMVILAEGVPVIVHAGIDQDYKLTPAALKKAMTSKTKLLVLNSPSNPTGVCYTRSELEALGAVLSDYPDVVIISDDIYEKIGWGDEPFCNIVMACPHLYDRTIIVNGASKAFAMTGWRLGYAAGPSNVIAAAKKIQSQSTSNPCSIAQAAVVAALNEAEADVSKMAAAFAERYAYFYGALSKLPGFKLSPAQGAFYLFPDVSGAIEKLKFSDDLAFAEALLDEAGIACVPGSAFGSPGSIRLSFAVDKETLEEAVRRLKIFCR